MSNISDKDKKDWNNFINSKNKLEDKDKTSNIHNDTQSKMSIDLHGYTLDQANNKVREVILNCFEKGIRNINIITGKAIQCNIQQSERHIDSLSLNCFFTCVIFMITSP